MANISTTIDPNEVYSISEVVKQNLIPNVDSKTGYLIIYNLCFNEEIKDWKRLISPVLATDRFKIKPTDVSRPGTKIKRWAIKWEELIRFLQLNAI